MASYYEQACQQAHEMQKAGMQHTERQYKALEEQVEARHKIVEDSCKDVVESVGERCQRAEDKADAAVHTTEFILRDAKEEMKQEVSDAENLTRSSERSRTHENPLRLIFFYVFVMGSPIPCPSYRLYEPFQTSLRWRPWSTNGLSSTSMSAWTSPSAASSDVCRAPSSRFN